MTLGMEFTLSIADKIYLPNFTEVNQSTLKQAFGSKAKLTFKGKNHKTHTHFKRHSYI